MHGACDVVRCTDSFLASLLTYLFGGLFGGGFVLIFILTILLLAADFYYLKNIAGRRLVGLRWWNEVDITTGESNMVFESADGRGNSGGNKTDNRFFWLAVYVQPALWIGLAILAFIKLELIWLSIVGMSKPLHDRRRRLLGSWCQSCMPYTLLIA